MAQPATVDCCQSLTVLGSLHVRGPPCHRACALHLEDSYSVLKVQLAVPSPLIRDVASRLRVPPAAPAGTTLACVSASVATSPAEARGAGAAYLAGELTGDAVRPLPSFSRALMSCTFPPMASHSTERSSTRRFWWDVDASRRNMNAGAGWTRGSQRWGNPERHRERDRQTVTKTDHDGQRTERDRQTKAQRQTDRRQAERHRKRRGGEDGGCRPHSQGAKAKGLLPKGLPGPRLPLGINPRNGAGPRHDRSQRAAKGLPSRACKGVAVGG